MTAFYPLLLYHNEFFYMLPLCGKAKTEGLKSHFYTSRGTDYKMVESKNIREKLLRQFEEEKYLANLLKI